MQSNMPEIEDVFGDEYLPGDDFDEEEISFRMPNSATSRSQSSPIKNTLNISLDNPEALHATLVETFEKLYTQESQCLIEAIENSRKEMKDSLMEIFEEQSNYKKQLYDASDGRYNITRKKGFINFII